MRQFRQPVQPGGPIGGRLLYYGVENLVRKYLSSAVGIGLLLVVWGIGWKASAQDTTSLLSAFLVNLRASHLILGSGGAVPVVSACGDGALQTGSTDTSGRVVGTTQTACTVTFGASFGANAADCVIANITANRGNISAVTNTAFTVSNLTAGDDFTYLCAGR